MKGIQSAEKMEEGYLPLRDRQKHRRGSQK